MRCLQIFTDASIKNLKNSVGDVGVGGVIKDKANKKTVTSFSLKKNYGKYTSAEAEYLAIIEGLNMVHRLGNVGKVEVFCDAKNVIDQISGAVKAKKSGCYNLREVLNYPPPKPLKGLVSSGNVEGEGF